MAAAADQPLEAAPDSIDERTILPPVREPTSGERQFPIPKQQANRRKTKSRRRTRSKRGERTASRRGAILIDRDYSYGFWSCFFWDKWQLEAKRQNWARVGGLSTTACHTFEELSRYETNHFYRGLLAGAVKGTALYLVLLLFLILAETNPLGSEIFRGPESSAGYLVVATLVIGLTSLARIGAIKHLSAYLLLALQTLIMFVSALGAYQIACRRVPSSSARQGPDEETGMISGAGHIPLFLVASIEDIFGLGQDKVRKMLKASRCEQAIVRLTAVNLLSDLVCFFASLRLVFI